MSELQRVGDLEIEQDPKYQRREWRAQRIGWGVMALIILAALLGLFGPGLFNQATVAESSLSLEYQRFRRFIAPAELRFHIRGGTEEQVRLWLSQDYLENVQIEGVTPQQDTVEAARGRLIYVFKRAEAQAPVTVTFHLTTQQIGPLAGEAGLDGDAQLAFRQFVFP